MYLVYLIPVHFIYIYILYIHLRSSLYVLQVSLDIECFGLWVLWATFKSWAVQMVLSTVLSIFHLSRLLGSLV